MWLGMVSRHALYSEGNSAAFGVNSLMTEPSERSGDRMGRPSKSRLTTESTSAMSSSKLRTWNERGRIASARLLLISDFPPPDTVHGLWQNAPSGTAPSRRQLRAAGCFASPHLWHHVRA